MGAAASVDSVAREVESLGPAYGGYSQLIVDNAVDGSLLSALGDDPSELSVAFDSLGIANQLHRRKLSLALREHMARPSAAESSTAAPAAAPAAPVVATPTHRAPPPTVAAIAEPVMMGGRGDDGGGVVEAAPPSLLPETPASTLWRFALVWEASDTSDPSLARREILLLSSGGIARIFTTRETIARDYHCSRPMIAPPRDLSFSLSLEWHHGSLRRFVAEPTENWSTTKPRGW